MKTFIVTVLIILLYSGSGCGQDKRNDLSFSYGIYSTNGAFDPNLDDTFIAMISFFDETSVDHIRETGPLFISYKYACNSWLGLGLIAGLSHLKYDLKERYFFDNSYIFTHVERSSYTAAAETEFRYIRRENYYFYSLAGFGYTFVDNQTKGSDSSMAYRPSHIDIQLSFIGIRFGKEIQGFAELGLGYKGLINFGVNFPF